MKWIIGIDEVGRGALAGPVTVAAAMLALDARGRIAHAPFRSLKDSKKLSAPRREFWAKELRDNVGVRFAVARVYPRRIERLNISAAANRAAESAFTQLLKDHKIVPGTTVYLDGGLYLGSKNRQRETVAGKAINAKTIIKADEKFPAVAAASIIAKVSRDRFMTRLAKRHPAYGFDIHKGYGTAAHLRAIKKSGPCDAHRLTFLAKPSIIDR
ncbi:MAG TPA: ribonuclease HII [Candidatus Paceibacterota bacterium]